MYTELLPVAIIPTGKGYGCVCLHIVGNNGLPCRPYCRKAASRRSGQEGPRVGPQAKGGCWAVGACVALCQLLGPGFLKEVYPLGCVFAMICLYSERAVSSLGH